MLTERVTCPDILSRANAGADNLLDNCVGAKAGETVLVVKEDQDLGYFDIQGADIVAERAKMRGANVMSLTTPRVKGPYAVPPLVRAAVAEADHTIFFSRIGDQMRFCGLPASGTVTMSYALDVKSLASDFCTLPHPFMMEFNALLQTEFERSHNWQITCPMGTEISGITPEKEPEAVADDFQVALFPVTVPKPVPANKMNGKIVLTRWVNSTNTHLYDPELHRLEGSVTAIVENGRIIRMEGEPDAVSGLEKHMIRVGAEFGIDPYLIHSWHAGINPKAQYFGKASDDPARWAGMMFGSPRYLHFHTCGDYAPGEICWHILDPTVTSGNRVLWDQGQIAIDEINGIDTLLAKYGLVKDALETCMDIGL